MANMQSGACIGKTHQEIWEMYRDAHRGDPLSESELRAIHLKWAKLGSEVSRKAARS